MNSPRGASAASSRRRAVVVVPVVVVLALLLATAWLAHRALQVRDALTSASAQLPGLQAAVLDGDAATAREALPDLQARTARARTASSDPLWRAAGVLPAVGDDLRAVSAVSAAVDDVAVDVLPRLLGASEALDPAALAGEGGRLQLGPLQAAAPALAEADDAARNARDAVTAVPVEGLLPQLSGPVGRVRDGLDDLVATTGAASRIAALVPPMAGADGRRTYMLLVQNNAELRATGGIPGAWAVVTADDGALELEQVGSAFEPADEPVLPLDPADLALHGDRMGRYLQSTTSTPRFPVAAGLAREMLRRSTGTEVDGVLSVDPVALSYVLAGTGPVALPTGDELSAATAVPLLLSDVYARYEDPAAQDDFFADAAGAVFEGLAAGEGDRRVVLAGLLRAGREGRLLAWSADEREQALLSGAAVGGDLPAEGGPDVGVFLDDGTEGKVGYYLRAAVSVRRACADAGSVEVETVLSSSAPALGLPRYVTGTRVPEGERGTAVTNVMVYGPADGGIATVALDGEDVPFTSVDDRGRPVALVRVAVPPGGSATVTAGVAGLPRTGAPSLRVTPMAQPADVTSTASCA
ncbi:DUF4012 domain-containing protein [Pseudokineococcus basanitobsidens]|uniref:DUF4012 domain-containing protein n=1 Tax=Pseudokineococcus basanitobsidens TaxID=1926649 RepID=A0ABU8RHY8_9ACTN